MKSDKQFFGASAKNYKPYTSELQTRHKTTAAKIKKLEEELEQERPKGISDAFMEKYQRLNLLRIELKTINDHIERKSRTVADIVMEPFTYREL